MSQFFNLNNRRFLGAKTKLLDFIDETINKEFKHDRKYFLDLFAGTGVVGYRFSNSFTNIYTNDLLVHNYTALNAFFGSEKIDKDLLENEIKLKVKKIIIQNILEVISLVMKMPKKLAP